MFRAALKLVLTEISETELTNMKFALMLNHDHFAQQGAVCHGHNPSKECSNGGYILLGFKDIGVDAERDLLFTKLDALPNPQGGESHKYQGAELYFELFRYLTSQGIYNGHNGRFANVSAVGFPGDDIPTYSSKELQNCKPLAIGDPAVESARNILGGEVVA